MTLNGPFFLSDLSGQTSVETPQTNDQRGPNVIQFRQRKNKSHC